MFTDEFEVLKPLEHHWSDIYAEFVGIQSRVKPWHESGLHNGLWSTYGIYHCGDRLEGEQLCPLTASLVHQIPGLFIAGFSLLKPNCKIKPHVGYTNEVYRSHLGLACPPQAWLKVDDETYHWRSGEVVVFDDTKMHSAENASNTNRVVLIVDFLKS